MVYPSLGIQDFNNGEKEVGIKYEQIMFIIIQVIIIILNLITYI